MCVLHLMAGLGETSGVANIARRFARVQTERGDAVSLLAPAFKWNPVYFGLWFAVKAFWRAVSADEIWVHCSWTFPVWYGAWLAKRLGKKLVVVPEASFDPKRLHNQSGWKKRLAEPFDRRVLRQADEVLALCRDEIGWVRDFEPAAKVRFERVPTFYKDVTMKPGKDGAQGGRPLHVLFLGRADDPLKGVRYLEQAVRELNGAGPTVELRVESTVTGAAKEAVWAWADILCLPTLSDNFGLVVAEALERGKRVIVTDGAPAWAELTPEQGRYLKGFRDGDDALRVCLLKAALVALARGCRKEVPFIAD